MEYKQLGRSDLRVSRIALGTMTFGRTNTEAEAFEQMDYALGEGVNLFDAAEMYPVPTDPAFQGNTERYIGNWMKARGNRDQVVLATKVAGPGEQVSYLRPELHFDRANIRKALDFLLATSFSPLMCCCLFFVFFLHWLSKFFDSVGGFVI